MRLLALMAYESFELRSWMESYAVNPGRKAFSSELLRSIRNAISAVSMYSPGDGCTSCNAILRAIHPVRLAMLVKSCKKTNMGEIGRLTHGSLCAIYMPKKNRPTR